MFVSVQCVGEVTVNEVFVSVQCVGEVSINSINNSLCCVMVFFSVIHLSFMMFALLCTSVILLLCHLCC